MTSIANQYRTITTGAGWIDRSERGRLRFTGRDVGSFLQALVTNDVQGLAPGQAMYAAYLTPQGRMIADLEVHSRPDDWIVETPEGQGPALAARFDSLVFTEDVHVDDLTALTFAIDVIGAGAAAAVASALGIAPADVAGLVEPAHTDWSMGLVSRGETAFVPLYKIIGSLPARDAVVRDLATAGAMPLTDEFAEALRIEAGRPRFGRDLTTETIPLEAGLLDRAISTTKGCYVGQEIIIRVLHRGGGRVAKRLVRLAIDWPSGEAPPAPGTALLVGDRAVGQLTSVARSVTASGVVALGYVARDDAEPGRRVDVAGRTGSAVIVGLAG